MLTAMFIPSGGFPAFYEEVVSERPNELYVYVDQNGNPNPNGQTTHVERYDLYMLTPQLAYQGSGSRVPKF